MAINSINVLEDKNPSRSLCSSNASNLNSCRLIQINFSGRESYSSRRSNKVNNYKDIKSPYLTNDKVQLLNKVLEKKLSHKKPNDIVSSFPLAVNLYKANSDEFKLKKRVSKKVKKSVLTLPNEPARMPKTHTVSDLNDSGYFNDVNDNNKTRKTKKRCTVKRNKKSRAKDPEMEYFDRDARYCSQMNIDLDCSSSEVINLNGNGEGISKLSYKCNHSKNTENDPNDVWAVLRNINKLQFRPSPPASQESVVPLRKRRPLIKKGNNCNDTRIIETCRTEEFSYISSYEVDSKSRDSCSPSSSFDRITVIDKQSEQDIMKQFSEQIFKSNLNFRGPRKDSVRKQNRERIEPRNSYRHVIKNKRKNDQILANTTLNKTSSIKKPGVKPATIPNDALVAEVQTTIAKTSGISITPKNTRENETLITNQTNNVVVTDRCANNNNFYNPHITMKSINAKFNTSRPIDNSERQLSGITKVVLSKGQDIPSSKLPEIPRKPRLALTLPNIKIPKITQTEIMRRLANLKFPIVILGKDQITNRGIHVANYDSLQFDGLDNHIWPFMREWSENTHGRTIRHNAHNEIVLRTDKPKNPKHKISQEPGDSASYSQKENESAKKTNYNLPLTNKHTKPYVAEGSSSKIEKPKPLSIIKSKMFQFLHKQPYPPKNNNWIKNKSHETRKDKITSTYEKTNEIDLGYGIRNCLPAKDITNRPDKSKLVKKSYCSLGHPWSKAKWTSDFIENIIKKIRSGVYYGIDKREFKYRINGTEVSTQTEVNVLINASCQNSIKTDFIPEIAVNKTDDPLRNIPGFDKSLATLEIETISKSKIAVKHCVANIVVQFDVQVVAETNKVVRTKNVISCIPIHQKDKEEKIFKCSTSIRNETLPAELCTIIPNMMRNILDANKKLLPTATVENVGSKLTAISEFKCPQSILPSVIHVNGISDQLRPVLGGHYTTVTNHRNLKYKQLRVPTDNINSITMLFQRLDMRILWDLNKPTIILQNTEPLNGSEEILKKPNQNKNRSSNCMALQPYEPCKLALIQSTGHFNIRNFINGIINKFNVKILNSILLNNNTYDQIYNSTYNNSIIISQTVMPLTPVNEIVVISLFNAFTNINRNGNDIIVQDSNGTRQTSTGNKENTHITIDENKIELESKEGKKKRKQIKVLNKKSYIKCYRKCNSMSSISTYKSTPLSKITNLDEFCQALGSSSITSALGGCLEKKILGAVNEMKTWIKEISPKQALLVLLLSNKKDTPNFIRLRPILLQGIAVNRITKADELDTEIEVIERENFDRLSQYEGITYLPASTQNQDSLLEELYWIAKTTASDYQKTFDESSEKLLKSLLEKRKKLNPSYLRVMARYVGLGLLTPAK